MIRLILIGPNKDRRVLTFPKPTVSIGRSPTNQICLPDLKVSKHHGRITFHRGGYTYEDLRSTNGSILHHDGQDIALVGDVVRAHAVTAGDLIRIGSYSIQLDLEVEPLLGKEPFNTQFTVSKSLHLTEFFRVQSKVVGADAKSMEPFLAFIRETASSTQDEGRLMDRISQFLLQEFPRATHLVLAVVDLESGHLRPLIRRSRDGSEVNAPLSSTIVNKVIDEGLALLFSQTQGDMTATNSVIENRIETAICAPLHSSDRPFGVVQLDMRSSGGGVFLNDDLDRLTVYASHIGLVLDNQRLYQEQRRAFHSTVNALVHSLSLKDPETANHSERVQAISLLIGMEMQLTEQQLEVLGVASVLHDMGKQGVRDGLLFKPGRLSPEEYREISEHASLTENVLNRVHFPAPLKSVPLVAAYHHEKMNGSGTYGIPGDQIPIEARVIAVADVFDALASARSYKETKPLPVVLKMLEKGRGELWDPQVLDAMHRVVPDIVDQVYQENSVIRQTSGHIAAGDDDSASHAA